MLLDGGENMREEMIQRMTRWTVFGVIIDDALFFEKGRADVFLDFQPQAALL
jgi:hypothetical protein